LSVDEVVSSELALPVPIGVDLVNEHRALLSAVSREIALTIALDVQLADAAGADDGVFEDAGENRLPPPVHVLRHADVDRKQPPDDGAMVAVRGKKFMRSRSARIALLFLLQLVGVERERRPRLARASASLGAAHGLTSGCLVSAPP
jgi:hypothetical protein